MSEPSAEAIAAVERWGILLLQDAVLPSVVGVVTRGERVRGSWWSHPASGAIYRAAEALEQHGDVCSAKLVAGKVTFIHRRLWPALVAVGRSRAPWQMRGLGDEARSLLDRVDREGRVRTRGKAARALEAKLLVLTQSVHTETGAHALELVGWIRFCRERQLGVPRRSARRAQSELEATVDALAAEVGRARVVPLPWR